MIPQPPFAGDLDLEQELEAFRALKPRLIEVWDALTAADDSHCTSVVVPSLTLNQGELSKLAGVAYYEERLLFLLIRLRNPRAHMVYVTSQPVHPMILDYYLNLLAGVPAAHARARLTMLCCHDASPRPLTQKIMERPRLVQRIREAIPDPKRTYLTVFNSTPLERKLAVLLGIPLNGLDPDLQYYGTKSGSRHVLRQAGVPMAEGYEDLHDESDIVKALCELQRKRPGLRRAIVKLNESFSGEGNAVVTYPEAPSGDVAAALSNLSLPTERDTRATFFGELRRMGGVVEEYVEAPDKRSPSVQLRTSPRGEVMPISTHDQILGGVDDPPGVQVMTIHKSKGKQFDGVIVIREGRHNGERQVSSFVWWDDEPPYWRSRKILRVGVTRAKVHTLILEHVFPACPIMAGHNL